MYLDQVRFLLTGLLVSVKISGRPRTGVSGRDKGESEDGTQYKEGRLPRRENLSKKGRRCEIPEGRMVQRESHGLEFWWNHHEASPAQQNSCGSTA